MNENNIINQQQIEIEKLKAENNELKKQIDLLKNKEKVRNDTLSMRGQVVMTHTMYSEMKEIILEYPGIYNNSMNKFINISIKNQITAYNEFFYAINLEKINNNENKTKRVQIKIAPKIEKKIYELKENHPLIIKSKNQFICAAIEQEIWTRKAEEEKERERIEKEKLRYARYK